MTSRIGFAMAVAAKGAVTNGVGLQQALTTMNVGEGKTGDWNPINTIWPEPGSTPFNTFGNAGQFHVWNYPDEATGVLAVTATLEGWPDVWAAVKANLSAETIIAAVDQVAEGRPGSYYAQFLPEVLASWPALGNVPVTGSPIEPPTTGDDMLLVKCDDGPHGPGTWYTILGGKAASVGANPVAFAGVDGITELAQPVSWYWLKQYALED